MYLDGNDRLIANRDQWMEVMQGDINSDPRLTRVGRFLRRYGLDELPRLLNVLNRTMSLVGPRMMNRAELLKYGHRIDGYCSVLPGLTGLWQATGRWGWTCRFSSSRLWWPSPSRPKRDSCTISQSPAPARGFFVKNQEPQITQIPQISERNLWNLRNLWFHLFVLAS